MRVAEDLNAALHAVMAADPAVYLLGEDIADPYGGAFKISRGLSTRFPGRVLATPISEGGFTGVAAGLALAGDAAIVEIMFGDFIALAFDQLFNFASKSVSMYGSRKPMRLIVRCPSGGGRGYGPTHSQSPMKHFIGMPGLRVYELSPFHDSTAVFEEMLAAAEPCLFIEDKVLYTKQAGTAAVPFRWTSDGTVARVYLDDRPDYTIIAPGGVAHRAMEAMRSLLTEAELSGTLLVPSRLWPLSVTADMIDEIGARATIVVEESTAGGTWGAEVAHQLGRVLTVVHSRDSVIPTAAHLERDVLVQPSTIHRRVLEALRG